MAGAKFRYWRGVETGTGTAVVRVPVPLADMLNQLRDSGADVWRVVRALQSVTQSGGDGFGATVGLLSELSAARVRIQELENQLDLFAAIPVTVPPALDGERLERFAVDALEAGRLASKREGNGYPDRVFLAAVFHHLQGYNLPEVFPLLLQAHKAGLLRLGRCDIPAAHSSAIVEESEIRDGLAVYHFLALPGADIEGRTDKPADRAALLALAVSRVAAGETVTAIAEDFNTRGWVPATYPGSRKGSAVPAQAWTIKTLYQAIQRAANSQT